MDKTGGGSDGMQLSSVVCFDCTEALAPQPGTVVYACLMLGPTGNGRSSNCSLLV